MYIVMLIEQHVQKYAFAEGWSDIYPVGSRLLRERAGITPDEITMTGKSPGVNQYGEANMIMYAGDFGIHAAEIKTDITYYVMD